MDTEYFHQAMNELQSQMKPLEPGYFTTSELSWCLRRAQELKNDWLATVSTESEIERELR